MHPGHARKLVSKLLDMDKGDSTFYYENIEGGHGGTANNNIGAHARARARPCTCAHARMHMMRTRASCTGAANNKQRAFMSTLAYDFLEQKLA